MHDLPDNCAMPLIHCETWGSQLSAEMAITVPEKECEPYR